MLSSDLQELDRAHLGWLDCNAFLWCDAGPRSVSVTAERSPSTCWQNTSVRKMTICRWRCTSRTPSSTASPSLTWTTCWRTSRWVSCCHVYMNIQYWVHLKIMYWDAGLYGAGTGQECGFLERHDHHYWRWNQQTAEAGDVRERTRCFNIYIHNLYSHHNWHAYKLKTCISAFLYLLWWKVRC